MTANRVQRAATSAARRVALGCRCDLPGAWVALLLALLSFTPSLLPRPPEFQGLLVGVNAALGYGAGLVGAWVWREVADRPRRTPRPGAWRVYAVTAAVTGVLAVVLGERWQRQLRELVGLPEVSPARLLLIPVIAALVFLLLLAVSRGFRGVYRWVSARLARRTSERAARAIGVLVVFGATVLLATGLVWDAAIRAADSSYALTDSGTPGSVKQPTTDLRSGGPGSLLDWEDLGREGRKFVGGGPSAEDISAFAGAAALEPIRTYAGVAAGDSTEERAGLAVADLERAGGFTRANLLVVTSTGTGWVEPSSAASFEYLTGGDSAIVSMQYSHLPSWLSFLVDQSRARESGRELFDAVFERYTALPADERPKLYVFGESLGSFGAETAFSGEFDMRNRIDGALFTGVPNFNPMYRDFVEDRDAGSTEVEPVYRNGRTIRFANRARDAIQPEGEPWNGTRVVYLQHPSDPVTWWSPDLLIRRPDWLEEERGQDVLPAMRWIPGVTFWQVTADLALCFSMPPGHGHTFTGEHVDGWAAVLRPEGWTPAKADELRAIIRGD